MKKEKLIFGHGLNDYNGQVRKNNRNFLFYNTWIDILKKCYSKDFQKKKPFYIGCTMCEEWHSLSKFKEWFDKHYIEGFDLSKDVFIRGNKSYFPCLCCFVPQEITNFLANNYRNKGDLPTGVCYHKQRKKYQAYITTDGKVKYLGAYHNLDEAALAYSNAKEAHARVLAERYKDKIAKRTYIALCNYEER